MALALVGELVGGGDDLGGADGVVGAGAVQAGVEALAPGACEEARALAGVGKRVGGVGRVDTGAVVEAGVVASGGAGVFVIVCFWFC